MDFAPLMLVKILDLPFSQLALAELFIRAQGSVISYYKLYLLMKYLLDSKFNR